MKTAHKIELDPTVKQARYFVQACGTDRFTWNWGSRSGSGNTRCN